jgi:DNA-binding response OmpR family regulator
MSQTATILVIDDEPQIRKFLRISLASQGYKVLEAGTGAEGLAQAALNKPDLLVLDLGLPDMDGQQVLREFREWATAPVLVLSVRASEGQKVQALDGGANDYVTKPFGIQEFLARVRALLRQAPAGEATAAAELRPVDGGSGLSAGAARRRRSGADAQGIRGAGATGAASRASDYPAAIAQGYLGADTHRGQPLSADCGGAFAAETGG